MKYPIPFTEAEIQELKDLHGDKGHISLHCTDCRWLATIETILFEEYYRDPTVIDESSLTDEEIEAIRLGLEDVSLGRTLLWEDVRDQIMTDREETLEDPIHCRLDKKEDFAKGKK